MSLFSTDDVFNKINSSCSITSLSANAASFYSVTSSVNGKGDGEQETVDEHNCCSANTTIEFESR